MNTVLHPARAVWLVARREIVTRVRSKSFVISTVLVLVALAAVLLIQGLSTGRSTVKVGLSGQATELSGPLRQATRSLGTTVETSTITDLAAGKRQVADGELDALVSGAADSLRLTVKDSPNLSLRNALDGLVRQQVLNGQLASAGLDPRQVDSTVDGAHVTVTSLHQQDPYRGARLAIGFIVMLLLFMSIQLFGQAVAQGVVEEKSSRVVEILLSTLRPWQLMTGKVIGVGVAGLAQIVIVAVVAGIGATASGAVEMPPASGAIIAWSVLWYVLGFFLFSSMLAAAASLVSRQEELPSVITPVTMLLLIPYIVGVSQIFTNPDSKLVEVLSLIPPFSPILMPTRIALDVAPAWQVGLGLVLTLLALASALWLASRIYANAVLRTGARVRLRDALATAG
ncbi:MAG: ABC transporter permease [Sciscionella sp.]